MANNTIIFGIESDAGSGIVECVDTGKDVTEVTAKIRVLRLTILKMNRVQELILDTIRYFVVVFVSDLNGIDPAIDGLEFKSSMLSFWKSSIVESGRPFGVDRRVEGPHNAFTERL